MDFRLKVFISAASNLNFTKTAKEMYISQPAVSKHIQELENGYNVRLFDRKRGALVLTPAGSAMLSHALKIKEAYHTLEHDMNLFSATVSGTLEIIASTTVSQYFLPTVIADFIARFPEIKINLTTANTLDVEKAVEAGTADLGFVEGNSRRQGLRYIEFMRDELVLATSAKSRCREEIDSEAFRALPLVLREAGSGTLDVMETELSRHNIRLADLNIITQFDNTESIKLFLQKSRDTFAVLSILSIVDELKEDKLKIIDIEGISFSRKFNCAIKQGSDDNLVQKFVSFLMAYHN